MSTYRRTDAANYNLNAMQISRTVAQNLMNHDDEDQQRPLPPSTAPYYVGDAYRFRMLPHFPRPIDVSDCSVGHDGGA